MAKPKKPKKTPTVGTLPNAYIEGAGILAEEKITETLEKNYMPYAMSVIISRALPEIDGFKPSHRKLLYTMYKMGLLTGARTKSANVVGQTMRLNPHGDGAIYDTMVRLSRGNETLLHPYVDSKGNFGKFYSRDMVCAASRYTEVKLDPICNELFRDIDKETVDFVPNYDNTMTEPSLLPASYPAILVNANMGIAVSMASSVCPFHLKEVCETCIALMKNPDHDLLSTLKGPDFPGGGYLVYDEDEMKKVYDTGRGSIRLRAKWQYDKEANCIEVTEIPYSTTIEQIMDKIVELVKLGKIREISYLRDETDLGGLKLALDLKRGTDPDKLMQKLFRLTPLQDNFSCNFNILIAGMPRVMGVREILSEWTAWRTECVRRRVYFQRQKKLDKLHLLKGLGKILLDIDKAIAIIRQTEQDAEVVPNLMIGFGIDQVQAEYVADIKLRNINKEFLLNRLQETESLEREIAELDALLASERKLRGVICKELDHVAAKYGQARKTQLVYDHALAVEDEPDVPDYPVTLFVSREGYLKKITPQSLRMSGEQKYKEGDGPMLTQETTSSAELLVFTDRCQVYKTRLSEFADTKASSLGDYLPGKLGFDEGESFFCACLPENYEGNILFFFENGKAAKVALSAYDTKSNRRKLTGAYSDKSPLKAVLCPAEDAQIALFASDGRTLIISSAQLAVKTTRATQGVAVMTLKKNAVLARAALLETTPIVNPARYRARSLPAAGALLRQEDSEEKQISLEL